MDRQSWIEIEGNLENLFFYRLMPPKLQKLSKRIIGLLASGNGGKHLEASMIKLATNLPYILQAKREYRLH